MGRQALFRAVAKVREPVQLGLHSEGETALKSQYSMDKGKLTATEQEGGQ